MAYFRVAKSGHNAVTDPVEDMLIDSDYQTLLVAFSGNGSITYTSVPSSGMAIGSSLGFVPSCVFITTGGINGGNLPSGVYSYETVNPEAGLQVGLFAGDPWEYYYPGSGTYNYMYYVYYLPSQESSSQAPNFPPNKPPYINITKNATENALTASLQNLSWTSQVQTMQMLSKQTFNVSGTVAAGGSSTFTFAHNLGLVTPFIGTIVGYYTYASSYSLSNVTCSLDTAIHFNNDQVGMDSTNLYYYYVNNDTANAHTIDFNVTIFFFIQPS